MDECKSPPAFIGLRPSSLAVALLVVAWAVLFAVRMAGPSDLMDNDQLRPAMYTLDVLRHGHWIIQTDPTGEVASKPPLSVWAAAAIATVTGRVDEWSLYVPTALAMLAVTLLVRGAGSAAFGVTAGWLAAGTFLLSPFAVKHLALARTDALFACLVTAAALLAARAWSRRSASCWVYFWIAAAAATLTKGPLGLVLAASGLPAVIWERRRAAGGASGVRSSMMPLAHVIGAALFLGLTAGWLAGAFGALGQPVIDKMIGRELLGHASSSIGGGVPFAEFYKPPLYFLTRFAPWSPLACLGLWRVFARASFDDAERRFERFLACWFLAGLAIFCAAPHQRADLLLPIIPAAALLAGRELARAGGARLVRRLPIAFLAAAAIAVAAVGVDRLILKRNDPMVLRTRAVREFARRLADVPGMRDAFVDVDAPFALQFFLQIHKHQVTEARAVEALAGPERVIVARGTLPGESFPGRVLGTVDDPANPGRALVVLITNDPDLMLPSERPSAPSRD